MEAKKIYKLSEHKDKLLDILEKISTTITSTMGPSGNTCILYGESGLHVTKDGVTVTEFLHFEDPFEEAINQIVKETARKTGEKVGDGTTTSILLACQLTIELIKSSIVGSDIQADLEILKIDTKNVISSIKDQTHDLDIFDNSTIDVLRSIVNLSSNGDKEITDMIINVVEQIGADGIIDVTEAAGEFTSTKIQEGMLIEAPAHVTKTIELLEPHIVLVSGAIEKVHQLKTCMDLANQLFDDSGVRIPIIIIAKEFSQEIQTIVTINNRNNKFDMYLAEADGFAYNMLEILDDMASILDCVILSTDSTSPFSLQNITMNHMGRVKSATISPQQTVLYSDHFLDENLLELKDNLVEQIAVLKNSGDDKIGEVRQLEKRLTKFAKSAIIRIGDVTDAAKHEKLDRVDDAVRALHAAVNGGVVPGGGFSLYHAAKNLNKNSHLKCVCMLPAELLGRNLYTKDEIYSVYDKSSVIDFSTGESGDPFTLGILDPADVQIKALQQAVAIVTTILNSYAVIVPVNPNVNEV